MRSAFIVVAVLLVASLITTACATSMTVPADGTIVTVLLTSGWYDVYASGTYRYDFEAQGYAIADAEWMRSTDYNWYEYPPLDPSQRICDLTINDSFFDWHGLQPGGQYAAHVMSPSHEYMVELYLSGSTDFQIFDPWYYYDNSGFLEVSIASVPEPSTVLAFGAGLVGLFLLRRRRT